MPHESRRLAAGQRACVIGAGCSGLAAAKALQERGVAYDQYEMTEQVGGLWGAASERSAAYKNLHLVTSKAHTAFSDHPMPGTVPTYGHRSDMQRYLESYARRFGLAKQIAFGRCVTSVARRAGGGWNVRVEGGPPRRYGAVLVCSGHHWDPLWPAKPGTFAGKELHARAYWAPEAFDGQRVLIVGGGNSGAGLAADLQGHARSVTLALRSGVWVVPKHVLGRPTDQWTGRYQTYLPFGLRARLLRLLVFLTVGNQETYGVPTPDHAPLRQHPTISDALLPLARAGAVHIKPDVSRLEGARVRFADGTAAPFDAIVYATGYRIRFPFLGGGEGAGPLYRQVVSPASPGLYFIGLVQAAGALPPLAERQSAWVAQLLAGDAELPGGRAMTAAVRHDEAQRRARYHEAPRHRLEVDFWDYATALEREMAR